MAGPAAAPWMVLWTCSTHQGADRFTLHDAHQVAFAREVVYAQGARRNLSRTALKRSSRRRATGHGWPGRLPHHGWFCGLVQLTKVPIGSPCMMRIKSPSRVRSYMRKGIL